MFCKNCGKEIQDGTKFCPFCGGKQDSGAFEKVEGFVDSIADKADEQTDKVISGVERAFDQNRYQGGVRLLKTDRSLLVYILLSIVTCGIYDFFFVHSLAKDVNEACFNDKERTPGAGIFILMWLISWAVAMFTGILGTTVASTFGRVVNGDYGAIIAASSTMAVPMVIVSIVRGIYPLYWRFKLGNKLQRNGNEYGLIINENGSTVIIWDLIGILCCCIGSWYALYILIKNTNTVCTAYNSKYVLNK